MHQTYNSGFLKGCPCLLSFWHYTSLKCAGAFKVHGVFIFWRAVHKIYLTSLTWKAHAHLLWPFCDSNYQHNEHATRQQVFNSESSWTQADSPQNKDFVFSSSITSDHFIELEMVAIIFSFIGGFLPRTRTLIETYGQINSNNGQGSPFSVAYKWFLNCNKFMINPENSSVVHVRQVID